MWDRKKRTQGISFANLNTSFTRKIIPVYISINCILGNGPTIRNISIFLKPDDLVMVLDGTYSQ
jgi:hypothetical protein